MFYAEDSSGTLQTLLHLSPQQLQAPRTDTYYCPHCKEALLIRSGTKVKPHFAHFPRSECVANRGESEGHEKGKWALYEWLVQHNYEAKLEYPLHGLAQRPDVFVTIGSKQIAVEYQCTRISKEEMVRRTTQYKDHDIFPFWIAGSKHLRRSGSSVIHMTEFLRNLLYSFNHHYHLYFFDSMTNRITIASNLRSITQRKILADLQSYPLSNIRFPQLFQTPLSSSLHDFLPMWEKLLYGYRTVYHPHVSRQEQSFRDDLYKRGLHFSLLPTLAFLPSRGEVSGTDASYIWQTNFLVNHFRDLEIGLPVFFPEQAALSTINGYQPDLMKEYSYLLESLGYIEKTENRGWIKKKQVVFHHHMRKALEDDRKTIAALKKLERINI
ncbi:competence protein CoiA [Halobacillus sp. K22]|uniref:competence protein CoiA n=1 Tax=Halobacillus sp. K22 TaxID=3457431 RepID=UPI003FCD6F64